MTTALSGCRSGAGPDFDALRNGWIADVQAKNLDGSLARYSEDATFFNPDGTHVTGSGAIRSQFSRVFDTYDPQISMIPVRIEYSGRSDLAFENGTYAEEGTVRATHTINHTTGDYLIVYQRASGGRWLISQQVWTEVPVPTKLSAVN